MEVFLVVVVLKPTEKQRHDEGAAPQIVVQPQAVLAKDREQACMKAYRFVP